MFIADGAAYYFLWTALLALLPVALGGFIAGALAAWLLWGRERERGGAEK